MQQAAVAGIGPNDFWDMTPRWVLSLVEAHREARITALRFEVAIEYMGVYWATRAKRMPTIAKALKDLGLGLDIDERAQTPEQMLAAARQWARNVEAAQRLNPAPPIARRARLAVLERWRAAQGKAAGEQ